MGEYEKRLARTLLHEVYEDGKLHLAEGLVHPSFVAHDPAHPDQSQGPEGVKQTASRLLGAFGDLRFEVEREIAEDDLVVQLVTMRGEHNGVLAGQAPTGRRFSVRHIYIWRIFDGKVIEHWGSRDDLGLLRQLGLLGAR